MIFAPDYDTDTRYQFHVIHSLSSPRRRRISISAHSLMILRCHDSGYRATIAARPSLSSHLKNISMILAVGHEEHHDGIATRGWRRDDIFRRMPRRRHYPSTRHASRGFRRGIATLQRNFHDRPAPVFISSGALRLATPARYSPADHRSRTR